MSTNEPAALHEHTLQAVTMLFVPCRVLLRSDYGWADAGWHRLDDHDPSKDVMTPNMNALVEEGIEMDRQYVYKYVVQQHCCA